MYCKAKQKQFAELNYSVVVYMTEWLHQNFYTWYVLCDVFLFPFVHMFRLLKLFRLCAKVS